MEKTSITDWGMREEPASIRSIIDQWPTRRQFAEALNSLPGPSVTVASVHKWAQAGTIPARFLNRVLTAHRASGFDLSAETLLALHDPAGTAANENLNSNQEPNHDTSPDDAA